MRILLAPDKFKGCLTASQVAQAMARGIRDAMPTAQIDICPISDGGEGFVDAILSAAGGQVVTRRVIGPLPDMSVDARFAIISAIPGDTRQQSSRCAVIEMSAAAGLALIPPDQYDPYATTTFGVGQLLRAAVDERCDSIVLGVGGSATIDGGIGCCQAAGLTVLLEGGLPAAPGEPLCGRDLPLVVGIKSRRGEQLAGVNITVACDVTNPLFGPNGAAHAFGPQKFARPPTRSQLDDFDHWLRDLARRCGKLDEAASPGAGAAGGLGFAMMAFFKARMKPGAELVIHATGLQHRLRDVDLCITGEGRFDRSSLQGKAPVRVAELCRSAGVPCHAIVGYADPAVDCPFTSIRAIADIAPSPDEAHARASEFLERLTRELLL